MPESSPGAKECPRGIGAALQWPSVWDHVTGPHPRVYTFAIPLAGVCLLVTGAISAWHLCRLSLPDGAGPRAQRRLRQMRTLAAAPGVIAAFKFAAILAPRIWKILFLLAALYEVFAFWTLVQLLLDMVAPSFDLAAEKLSQESDAKMWAVLPFACCFKSCVRPMAPRREDLLVIRCLVWQFILIVPVVAGAEMAETDGVPQRLHHLLPKLEVLSMMVAMYGIFALLEATHLPLEGCRTHAKFWVVKGTFIANLASFRVACHVIQDDVRVGKLCYTSETVATAWSGLVAAVLTVPLAALGSYSFPQGDLDEHDIFENSEKVSKAK